MKAQYGPLIDEVRRIRDHAEHIVSAIESRLGQPKYVSQHVSLGVFIEDFEHYLLLGDKGLIRSEGKEYTVKDGDVCHFKFNV